MFRVAMGVWALVWLGIALTSAYERGKDAALAECRARVLEVKLLHEQPCAAAQVQP